MAYIPTPQRSWQTTVTTGFNATVPDLITLAIFNSSLLLLTGTVTLCANPLDGQPLTLIVPKGITAFVLNVNAGQTMGANVINAAGANLPIRLKFSGINSTWYAN